VRSTRIIGEDGTIQWVWPENIVRLFEAKHEAWRETRIDEGMPEKGYKAGEKMYIDEMSCFLEAVKGQGRYIHSLDDDLKILSLLHAAERSSIEGRHVRT
jgi:hypothetical protein